MALQINVQLNGKDGSQVPIGAYVKIEVMFPMEEDSYNVMMKIWRSVTAYESGYSSIKVVEIPKQNYTKVLTPQEMAAMTPVQIHEEVKTFLEGYVGVGNVTIV